MKTYLYSILFLAILLNSYTGQCQSMEDILILSKEIAVKKEIKSGLYVLYSKKHKTIDTLSYIKGDSLHNFTIDTLSKKNGLNIVLHYNLLNNSKGINFNCKILGNKFTIINLTKQKVTYSLLSNFDYHRTNYHNYSYPNDANSIEETDFECSFKYEILTSKSINLISIRTSGMLAGDYHYLKDYLTYHKGKEGVYVLEGQKLVKQK